MTSAAARLPAWSATAASPFVTYATVKAAWKASPHPVVSTRSSAGTGTAGTETRRPPTSALLPAPPWVTTMIGPPAMGSRHEKRHRRLVAADEGEIEATEEVVDACQVRTEIRAIEKVGDAARPWACRLDRGMEEVFDLAEIRRHHDVAGRDERQVVLAQAEVGEHPGVIAALGKVPFPAGPQVDVLCRRRPGARVHV